MSVARNLWRAADAPHIVPADSVERQTAQRLINACPAGLFSLTPEGGLRVNSSAAAACSSAPSKQKRNIRCLSRRLPLFSAKSGSALNANMFIPPPAFPPPPADLLTTKPPTPSGLGVAFSPLRQHPRQQASTYRIAKSNGGGKPTCERMSVGKLSVCKMPTRNCRNGGAEENKKAAGFAGRQTGHLPQKTSQQNLRCASRCVQN